jgi:hypothetical protein
MHKRSSHSTGESICAYDEDLDFIPAIFAEQLLENPERQPRKTGKEEQHNRADANNKARIENTAIQKSCRHDQGVGKSQCLEQSLALASGCVQLFDIPQAGFFGTDYPYDCGEKQEGPEG